MVLSKTECFEIVRIENFNFSQQQNLSKFSALPFLPTPLLLQFLDSLLPFHNFKSLFHLLQYIYILFSTFIDTFSNYKRMKFYTYNTMYNFED
jgi:hypothetical protein